jgi:hypothetical protein
MSTIFWLENLKGKDHSEDLEVDGNIRMGLSEIGWEGVDWIHLAGSCEHGNEPSGSIGGGGGVRDYLCDCLDLKKDCAPWSWLVGRSVSQSVSLVLSDMLTVFN